MKPWKPIKLTVTQTKILAELELRKEAQNSMARELKGVACGNLVVPYFKAYTKPDKKACEQLAEEGILTAVLEDCYVKAWKEPK